jgi:hypothetical protein
MPAGFIANWCLHSRDCFSLFIAVEPWGFWYLFSTCVLQKELVVWPCLNLSSKSWETLLEKQKSTSCPIKAIKD